MQDDKKKLFKEMTFLEKWNYLKGHITVEPMLCGLILPSCLLGLATQNLNLEKACRVNMNYGDHICDAITRREAQNYTLEEKTVQQLVAGMQGWKTILQSFLPCMLILFWGSWSDRHQRRKPCMLIPIVGEFCAAIGLILCTYFKRAPMEVAGVTEALFPGLAGGWFTMLIGVFSYIADITTEEERTLRIGVVSLCVSSLIPLGIAMSGILLRLIGFYGVFSLSASLYLCAFFYGLFYIKEVKDMVKKDDEVTDKPQKSFLADFFDRKHVVETFTVAFKKGENRRRTKVILLMCVVMVVIGPLHGEMSVAYLYTRMRFNWSEIEFSLFSCYNTVTHLIGTSFSVGVFSRLLQIHDALLGVISTSSKVIGSLVFAFATTTWEFLMGPLVEILNGTSFIAMRSIASKLVASNELGKVNSLFGVCEALMPLLYAPMYTQVYKATIDTFPGLFYLLGGGLTLPAVAIFLWMYAIDNKCNSTTDVVELNGKASVIEVEAKVDDSLEISKEDLNTTAGESESSGAENSKQKESLPTEQVIEIDKESSSLQ